MQLKLHEPETAAEIYTQLLDKVRGYSGACRLSARVAPLTFNPLAYFEQEAGATEKEIEMARRKLGESEALMQPLPPLQPPQPHQAAAATVPLPPLQTPQTMQTAHSPPPSPPPSPPAPAPPADWVSSRGGSTDLVVLDLSSHSAPPPPPPPAADGLHAGS